MAFQVEELSIQLIEALVPLMPRIRQRDKSLEDQRAHIAHELLESLDGGGGDERARKVAAIRAALAEGEQSGIAEDSSLEGILSELRSARAR